MYLHRNPVLDLPVQLFPDRHVLSAERELKYHYILIREKIVNNSGQFSCHYLLQIKPANKLENLPPSEHSLCRWNTCLAPIATDNLDSFVSNRTEASLRRPTQTRKSPRKPKLKKILNPVKSRSASDSSLRTGYCNLHSQMRKFLHPKKKEPEEFKGELWRATIAGLSWQSELVEPSRFNCLLNGDIKKSIVCLLDSAREEKNNKSKEEYKILLEAQVGELKTLRNLEVSATSEMLRIQNLKIPSSYYRFIQEKFSDVLNLSTIQKLNRTRYIREKLEEGLTALSQSFSEKPHVQAAMRPLSVPKNMGEVIDPKERARKRAQYTPYMDSQIRMCNPRTMNPTVKMRVKAYCATLHNLYK